MAAATAFVMVMLTVVIALNIGIEHQMACKQCFHSFISIAADATKELNANIGQCHLGTATYTAANQHVGMKTVKQFRQGSVAAAVGADNLGGSDLAIFYIVNLKAFSMAEMLEDFTVFIGYCDSHSSFSLL